MVYKVMNSFLITIDSNYNSGIEKALYLKLLREFYQSKGFTTKTFFVEDEASLSTTLDIYRSIYRNAEDFQIIFIDGGFVQSMAKDLPFSTYEQVHFKYEELARVFEQITLKYKSLHVFLTSKDDLIKIERVVNLPMNIQFDLQAVNTSDKPYSQVYADICQLIQKKGWITPPPLFVSE